MDRCSHRFTEGDQQPSVSGVITDENGAHDLTGLTVRLSLVRDPAYRQDILEKDFTTGTTDGLYDFGNWLTTDLIHGEDQEVTIKVITATIPETVDRWTMCVDGAT